MAYDHEEIIDCMARQTGDNQPFVVATVVRTEDSTAGKPGDKAVIRADGTRGKNRRLLGQPPGHFPHGFVHFIFRDDALQIAGAVSQHDKRDLAARAGLRHPGT